MSALTYRFDPAALSQDCARYLAAVAAYDQARLVGYGSGPLVDALSSIQFDMGQALTDAEYDACEAIVDVVSIVQRLASGTRLSKRHARAVR